MKPVTEFYRSNRTKDGFRSWCKPCCHRSSQDHYVQNKAQYSDRQRKYLKSELGRLKAARASARASGICEEDITRAAEARIRATGCEICGSDYCLAMDHDHQTGRFRGILCRRCNLGLGQLGDNRAGVRAALDYLCTQPFPTTSPTSAT